MGRASALTCAAATAALLLPAGGASAAEDAVSYAGTLVDGVCVFGPDARIPGGHRGRTGDDCVLVVTPLPAAREPLLDVAVGASGSDAMAKSAGEPDDAAAAGIGYPSLSSPLLRDVPDVLGGAVDIVMGAVNGADRPRYQKYTAFAQQVVYDEFGRMMYTDHQEFDYRRRLSDGTMLPPTPTYASCQARRGANFEDVGEYLAGGGPYDPEVRVCWTEIRTATPQTFEFATGGWYETWVRTPPYGVPSVRKDFRKLRTYFITHDTGFVPHQTSCTPEENPPGWAMDCIVEDIPGAIT